MTLNARAMEYVPEHVRLRPADEAECFAVEVTPEEALQRSWKNSLCAYTLEVKGEVVGYWGYSPLSVLGDICFAWLLTTPAADKYPIHIGRASRKFFAELLVLYRVIIVHVDPLHTKAIKWLTWLGFVYHSSHPGFDQMVYKKGPAPWVS